MGTGEVRGPPHRHIVAERGDGTEVLLHKCRQLLLLREVSMRSAWTSCEVFLLRGIPP